MRGLLIGYMLLFLWAGTAVIHLLREILGRTFDLPGAPAEHYEVKDRHGVWWRWHEESQSWEGRQTPRNFW